MIAAALYKGFTGDFMYDRQTIRKQIFYLMIPIILENFLQLLTNLIATAMVGRLTEMDISAQGMCTKIVDIIYYIFRGAGTALVILVAKKFAQEKVAQCRTIFQWTAASIVVIGIVLGTILFIQPYFWLRLFTNDTELILWASKYIRILLLCLPFWGVMLAISSVFQGKGDTKTPMFIAAGVNVINIFLCYGLIFGHFGLPEMGFLGAAVSLVVSRIVGCAAGLILLYNRKFGLFSFKEKGEPVPGVLKEIYSIGLPNAGEAIIWQFASILLSRVILSYGQNAFAAYQLGVQSEYITEIPAIGFTVAATSLISRSIGLRDAEMFQTCKVELVRICTMISVVTSALLIFLPKMFMDLLTDNEALTRIGIPYVMIMGTIQIPQNLIKIYGGILRSANYKTTPLLVQMIGTWGIRIPTCLLCAYVLHLPIYAIWICIAADQLTKFLLIRYFTDQKQIHTKIETL